MASEVTGAQPPADWGLCHHRRQRQGSASHQLRWTCPDTFQGDGPTQPGQQGLGKSPRLFPTGVPCPVPASLQAQRGLGPKARNAQESPRCAWVQAEAMWGARGFQGDTGQTPCVLTTVTRTAHWETQCKAPCRQRSRLINTPQGGCKQGFPPNAMILPNPKKGEGLRAARVPHPPPTNTKKSSTATTPESQKPARGCPLRYGRLCPAQSTPTPPQHQPLWTPTQADQPAPPLLCAGLSEDRCFTFFF